MRELTLRNSDVFGLVRPSIDAHTLGIASIAKLLEDCGYRTVICGANVADAVAQISKLDNIVLLEKWLRSNEVTRLGYSFRLHPREAQLNFGCLMYQLSRNRLLQAQGGPLKAVFFAGLPEACQMISREYKHQVEVFYGDETPAESLSKLRVPPEQIPLKLKESSAYDEARMRFGRALIQRGDHLGQRPIDRAGYREFATREDGLVARLRHSRLKGLPPIMRAHVGPYLPDHAEAIREFKDWLRRLARGGYLDIVSIGTSQLTQSNFGEDWEGKPNGGGVPVNSPAQYDEFRDLARPMLLRTYAGTKNVPALAQVHEEYLNIAWHALSFWWFCQIDGRGPNEVAENLRQHLETLRYIAATGKPFEPNIPHHFAFRGADDVSYVVSGALAVKTAKRCGIRSLVLQTMLNTPKSTWGVQDLAKARALLRLARDLEDDSFSVFLQPRAGLDFFSHDLEKAKAQLAAVTALMDDIEPGKDSSPDIIHVVSYSEASHLATPEIIDESIKITLSALQEYRRLRKAGEVENMAQNEDAAARTDALYADAKEVIAEIEKSVINPYSVEGLYKIFHAGFLPVPYLWERREEFRHAVEWKTDLVNGGIRVVDYAGRVMPLQDRLAIVRANL